MKYLALQLTIAAGVCCIIVFFIGLVQGIPYRTLVLSSLSLAFAIIPEEIPILIKAVLAIGSLHLSKEGILVKTLKAAEALGSISVILADKTGTLTKNVLSLQVLSVPGRTIHVLPSQPLTIHTNEMSAFIPLFEQWLMSSSTLLSNLAVKRDKQGTLQCIMNEKDIIQINDTFDRAILQYFFHDEDETETHDLNNAFSQLLINDCVQAAMNTEVVKVLPYSPWRRRSSCIRVSVLHFVCCYI